MNDSTSADTSHGSSIAWRRSSRSNSGGGQCVEVGSWRKSTRSNGSGGQACVEAASCACHGIAVRDSKHLTTPPLALTRADWTALLTTVKAA